MRIVFALCLMLISTGCHANDIMQGHWESSRPSAGRKANGHFGANMVLTALDALLKALICEDLDLMHQYFACCNARRHASNLEPVGFLRWIGGREANEVLLWRMLNAASKH